jgi:hypothetical protein
MLMPLIACATTQEREGPVPLAAGDRVRVSLASRVATGRLQGTLVSVSPDTLVVAREEGGERRLSRGQVEEVEVSVSRTQEPVKAAQYGVLAAAPFLVLALLFVRPVAGEAGTSGAVIVFVPVVAAAAVGAAIGSGVQDVWVEADWSSVPVAARSDSVPSEPR